MCCSVLQCVAVCCSVLQCVAVCHCVVLCVAVCCSVLQCVAVRWLLRPNLETKEMPCLACSHCIVLQCIPVCCSVLQCVAVCCSALCKYMLTHKIIFNLISFFFVVQVHCGLDSIKLYLDRYNYIRHHFHPFHLFCKGTLGSKVENVVAEAENSMCVLAQCAVHTYTYMHPCI